MKIGYARVSTDGQDLSLQLDSLKQYGCEKVFSEKVSSRSELLEKKKAFSFLREGDTLVVWKLDRLARSTMELLGDIQSLSQRGIGFISLKDSINTSTANGRFQLAVFAALAELERDMIRERTIAGLEAARLRGRFGGRPKGMGKDTKKRCEAVHMLTANSRVSVEGACKLQKLSKATYYKWLRSSDS